MLIRINPQSEEPLFEQIAFAIKQAAARGDLAPGDRLPSVRELARELAINPNTVVHAYEILAREGIVTRRQGAGCFVSGKTNGLAGPERRRLLDELVGRAVTEAFHLGFGADDLRRALEQRLRDVQFPERKRGQEP
jgi:GntR family transcriptional regulator